MTYPVSFPIYLDIEMLPVSYELNVEDAVEENLGIDTQIIVNEIIGEKYEGPYVITPQVTQQIVKTDDLVMTDDVTILEIPYSETSNLSGGYTAIIG